MERITPTIQYPVMKWIYVDGQVSNIIHSNAEGRGWCTKEYLLNPNVLMTWSLQKIKTYMPKVLKLRIRGRKAQTICINHTGKKENAS